MTATNLRATNPLSGEELHIQSIINETVDSKRLAVLRTLNELADPVKQSDITQGSEVSRQPVSNHLAVLRDRGFVNSREGEIELTAGGILFLDITETALETVTPDDLAFLTRTDYPLPILDKLAHESYQPRELRTALSNPPSNATIRRALKTFDEKGWAEKTRSHYEITATGRQTLDAYTELARSVEQLIDKAPWFQRLPPSDATVPVQDLAGADLVVSDPRSPSSVLSTALTLYDRNVDQFRGLCSIYNTVLFQTYSKIHQYNIGPDFEVVLDQPTFRRVTDSTDAGVVLENLDRKGYEPFVLDQSHTLGIGLYDSRKVAVGAYNESGRGQHIAMIVSENENVVEWGKRLYESYRDQAERADELD